MSIEVEFEDLDGKLLDGFESRILGAMNYGEEGIVVEDDPFDSRCSSVGSFDDNFIDDVISMHTEINNDASIKPEVSEVVYDDELLDFLSDTAVKDTDDIDLTPMSSDTDAEPVEEIAYPFMFLDKITDLELSIYKGEHILYTNVEENEKYSLYLPLCLKIDEEFVHIGWVKACLHTFLGIKRLCKTRKVYLVDGLNSINEVTSDSLSGPYLLDSL